MDALPVARSTAARALAALVVCSLLVPVGVSAVTYKPPDLKPGTVEEPADNATVVGVQGFHFEGQGSEKKPARLLSLTGDARYDWQFNHDRVGAYWFYDVDPVGGDDLLATATKPSGTIVIRFDRQTREMVWTEEFAFDDTHDVDHLGDGKLLVANMRNYEDGVSNDRVLVYDRERDEVVWEWVVRKHYPNSTDGGFKEDWTHVNDVDRVGDGLYLVSLRNFDQVVVVNRSTKEIELRLGSDDDHDVLFEQHNPDLIRGEDGSVSILVADSENDRVVEYRRDCEGASGIVDADPEDCEWTRTWTLSGLNWPRDADRLPNGNTLVTDTLNHRVIEVTPEGRIVWEYYATWGPYDAERIGAGPGSNGPPMHAVDGAPERANVSNSAGVTPGTGGEQAFHEWVTATFAGTPVGGPVAELANRWSHVVPWLTPNWMSGWDVALTVLGVLVLAGWAAAESYWGDRPLRHRLRDGATGLLDRARAAAAARR